MTTQHPAISPSESLARYHARCEEYHLQQRATLIERGNYRDAGTHGDQASLHRNAAKFLANLDAQQPAGRDLGPDERDDLAIGR